MPAGQYLSIRYSNRLTEAGIEPSVGSVGDSYDNALAESVIGLYKTELIRTKGPWRDLDQVEYATLEYVDWFYHRRLLGTHRRHTTSRKGGQLPSRTRPSPGSWCQVKHSPANPGRFTQHSNTVATTAANSPPRYRQWIDTRPNSGFLGTKEHPGRFSWFSGRGCGVGWCRVWVCGSRCGGRWLCMWGCGRCRRVCGGGS